MHRGTEHYGWRVARARGLIALLGTLAAAGSVQAARLGDITHTSALNQPLDVQIDLGLDRGDDVGDIKVRLASETVYDELGLLRDNELSRAELSLARGAGGGTIRVTTQGPVHEPLLFLVVEASVGGMTLRRAYDVLFDPPSDAAPAIATVELRPALPLELATTLKSETPLDRLPPERPRDPLRRRARHEPEPAARTAPPACTMPAAAAPPPPLPAKRFQMAWKLGRVPGPGEFRPTPPPAPAPPAPGPALACVSAPPAMSLDPPSRNRRRGFVGALDHGLDAFSMYGWVIAVLVAFMAWMRAREAAAIPIMVAPRRDQDDGQPPLPMPDPDVTQPRRWVTSTGNGPANAAEARLASSDLYDGMIRMLTKKLQDDPRRSDLWLKLLEVSHANGSVAQFIDNAESMVLNIGRDNRIWDLVVEMGSRLAPEHPLFTRPAGAAPLKNRRYYDGLDITPLKRLLDEVDAGRRMYLADPAFATALADLLAEHAHRPTPFVYLRSLSEVVGGARIYAKREDQAAPGCDLITHAFGQVLLAKALGKAIVVCSSNTGELGAAMSIAASATGLRAVVYVPRALFDDTEHPAHKTMRAAEANVTVTDFTGNEFRRIALLHAMDAPMDTMYVSNLRVGPPVYQALGRSLQGVIGQEVRRQAQRMFGQDPDAVVCHHKAGIAALGLMQPFLDLSQVRIECVDSGGDEIAPHSGGLAREHSWLRALHRVNYKPVDEAAMQEAWDCFGLLPEIELGGHDLQTAARAIAVAKNMDVTQSVVAMFVSGLQPRTRE